MGTEIHWFRRDLRIADNTALNAASASEHVLPVYILSEWNGEHAWCGAARQEFLCGCLTSLHRNLEAKGGRLIIRKGRAAGVLEQLVRESGADAIHFNRDPDPAGRATEIEITTMAARLGVKVHAHKDVAIHERDEVLTGEGNSFRVFTPYSRAWAKLEKPAPGRTLARISVPPVRSDPLPTLAHWGLTCGAQIIEPGESAGRKRLSRFLDGPVLSYSQRRDLPSEDGGSRLSQDLRFGTLSIREVFAKCQQGCAKTMMEKASVATFINELIWREFYMQVLWRWPEVLEHEFQPATRSLKWRAHWRPGSDQWSQDAKAHGDFTRWCCGQTGFPIVDAGMRQLAATGYMHNRVRMIVAMFLTKDIRLWWMHGESWFMQKLVDGEIASNNGGWQWSASTGTDAAPYFRIQNPWSQTKRFDRDGTYIRRWVPELRDVPAAKLCAPGDTPLAKAYPLPMLDHHAARDATLEMFAMARD